MREDVLWMPEDFLGGNTREERKAQHLRDQFDLMRLDKELAGPIAVDKLPDVFRQLVENTAKKQQKG